MSDYNVKKLLLSQMPDADQSSFESMMGSMKILTVNNVPYSDGALNDAITGAMKPGNPVVLLATRDNVVTTLRMDYTGGLKYAHLEPISGATDYLTESCKAVSSASEALYF